MRVDPFLYGQLMLERERTEAIIARWKLERAFEEYKKRVRSGELKQETKKIMRPNERKEK